MSSSFETAIFVVFVDLLYCSENISPNLEDSLTMGVVDYYSYELLLNR